MFIVRNKVCKCCNKKFKVELLATASAVQSQAETRDVLCLGETMVLFASGAESLRNAESVEMHVAGAESNVAIGLSLLGHEIEWFSRLGEDPFGARVLD